MPACVWLLHRRLSKEALIYNASGIRASTRFGVAALTGHDNISLMHAMVAFLDPMWVYTHRVFRGLHVFACNLVQMYVFRRYDFVTMSALRLAYYLQ